MRKKASIPQKKKNKAYKQKIYKLCNSAKNGNEEAQIELEEELKKHTLAVWAVKHWVKLHQAKSKNKHPLDSDLGIKARKKVQRGNAFMPYQGGAVDLGKN